MLAKVKSGCVMGIDAYPIDVEVDVSNGLPAFSVVGLPDTAIRESRDRIRSAIKNSDFKFPSGRITVNLSPADIKKEGVGLDLPIAIGVLCASGHLDQNEINDLIFCGELSLNGKLRSFRGALPVAMSLKKRCGSFLFPEKNAYEVSNIENISVYGSDSLKKTVEHLKGITIIEKIDIKNSEHNKIDILKHNDLDFKDVKGQEHVKRGLEIAASGNHNVLLLGPPGSGKSMLAKRFTTILPGLSNEESLETSIIYSVAGDNASNSFRKERPIRNPHHTISYAAMVGGGSWPLPGEITLAHNGVLFLDEFPEFRRDVLETLRQPIESGEITIARVQRSIKYPCRFLLVAAMNPCPCGYFTDPNKNCSCTPSQIQRYIAKISGPLLDRIDIHLEVPRLNYDQLSAKRTGENSETIKTRVTKTRTIQKTRFNNKISHMAYNAYMSSKEVEQICILSKEAEELLKTAILELGISARAYNKILTISRTIADMEETDIIQSHHISEAIGYRCLDRNLWY